MVEFFGAVLLFGAALVLWQTFVKHLLTKYENPTLGRKHNRNNGGEQ
jgi:hypothetical protein